MNPYHLIKLLGNMPEDAKTLHHIIHDIAAECPEVAEDVLHRHLDLTAFKYPHHENIPIHFVEELVQGGGRGKKVQAIKELRELLETEVDGRIDRPPLKWAKEKVEEAMDNIWGPNRH